MESKTKIYLRKVGCESVDRIEMTQIIVHFSALANMVMPSSSIKAENLLTNRVTELFMQYSYHGVNQLIRCSLLFKKICHTVLR